MGSWGGAGMAPPGYAQCSGQRPEIVIGGWKAYYGLEKNCKSVDLWSWDKNKILFETLVTPVILYGCEVWGCSISRESWRKIDKIQKNFITYNLKIKGNKPYLILFLETSLSSIAMTIDT